MSPRDPRGDGRPRSRTPLLRVCGLVGLRHTQCAQHTVHWATATYKRYTLPAQRQCTPLLNPLHRTRCPSHPHRLPLNTRVDTAVTDMCAAVESAPHGATTAPCPVAHLRDNEFCGAGKRQPCYTWGPGRMVPPCPPEQQTELVPATAADAAAQSSGSKDGDPPPPMNEQHWMDTAEAALEELAPWLYPLMQKWTAERGRCFIWASMPHKAHSGVSGQSLRSVLKQLLMMGHTHECTVSLQAQGEVPRVIGSTHVHLGAVAKEPDVLVDTSACRVVGHDGHVPQPGARIWRQVRPGLLRPHDVPDSYPAVNRDPEPGSLGTQVPDMTPVPLTAQQVRDVHNWDDELAHKLATVDQGTPLWKWGRNLYNVGSSSGAKALGHGYHSGAARVDKNMTGAAPPRRAEAQQKALLKQMLWGASIPTNRAMQWGNDHEPVADECADGVYALRDAACGAPTNNHVVLHMGLLKNTSVCPYAAVSVDGIVCTGLRDKPWDVEVDGAPDGAAPWLGALPVHLREKAAWYQESGLMEHKCPQSMYRVIPPAYYDQIQLSMAVLRLPYADFTVWRPDGFAMLRFPFNAKYAHGVLLPALTWFYEKKFIPALVAKHRGLLQEGDTQYIPRLDMVKLDSAGGKAEELDEQEGKDGARVQGAVDAPADGSMPMVPTPSPAPAPAAKEDAARKRMRDEAGDPVSIILGGSVVHLGSHGDVQVLPSRHCNK